MKIKSGSGEVTRWVRALAALQGHLGSVPSIHTVAHNCLELHFQRIWCPVLASEDTVP